jgi:hypothetical protein
MCLIGSLTEDHLREELTVSNAALRAGSGNPALCAALLSFGADPKTALVLDWIPEQSEDIYIVLDGIRRVLTIELPRGESGMPPAVTVVPFATFRESIVKGSRQVRLKFAVALALLQEISENDA